MPDKDLQNWIFEGEFLGEDAVIEHISSLGDMVCKGTIISSCNSKREKTYLIGANKPDFKNVYTAIHSPSDDTPPKDFPIDEETKKELEWRYRRVNQYHPLTGECVKTWNNACDIYRAGGKHIDRALRGVTTELGGYFFAFEGERIDVSDKRIPNCWWKAKEHVLEAARMCKSGTQREFTARFGRNPLMRARKEGYEAELNLKRAEYTDGTRIVYRYLFRKSRTAYVGITNRPNERHLEHVTGMRGNTVCDSPVFRFMKESGEKPEYEVLERGISGLEAAQAAEDRWKKKSADDGWAMLNKAKTGVGTGSLGSSMKNTSKRVLDILEKFRGKPRSEFMTQYPGVYGSAKKLGIWDKVASSGFFADSSEVRSEAATIYTKERCMELVPGPEPITVMELRDTVFADGAFGESVYRSIVKHDWWSDFPYIIREKRPNGFFGTLEKTKEYIEDCGYTTWKEVMSDGGLYAKAIDNGWTAEDLGVKRENQVHITDEYAIDKITQLKNSGDIKCITDIVRHPNKEIRGIYAWAQRNGKIDSVLVEKCGIERIIAKAGSYDTFEKIKAVVEEGKCKTRLELKRYNGQAYVKMLELKLDEKIFPGTKQYKTVYAWNADTGKYIGEYKSQGLAAKELKICQTSISDVLNRKITRVKHYTFSYDKKFPVCFDVVSSCGCGVFGNMKMINYN